MHEIIMKITAKGFKVLHYNSNNEITYFHVMDEKANNYIIRYVHNGEFLFLYSNPHEI